MSAQDPAAAGGEGPDPWYIRIVNHIMTPGSSHSDTVLGIFNVIVCSLVLLWFLGIASFYNNIHYWVFGVLLFGLCVSTNVFMKEIMKAKAEEKAAAEQGSSDGEKKSQ
jgi:hypothetical protein